MHPLEVLERYWNYRSFKPLQEDIIQSVLDNNDTFTLLPTGGGKSICFQVPALIQEGICIVVSPLIALMKDQVNQLKQKGIKAVALTSGMSYKDLDIQLDNCIYGNYKFLYLSPERLQQPLVKERVQQMKVNLIAVDEAHCISEWGNDFRPAYRNIKILREIHPHVTCIALTATAKTNVIDDIISNLDFVAPKIFKGSFNRPNIGYHVIHTDDKLFYLEHILKKHPGPSIIYVRTRRATLDVHNYLKNKGFSSTYYHGGITNTEKQERLNQWLKEQREIMIATTAFGMGIDKANVKSIIHYNLPESLENYYQEAGRAGRNGDPANAYILKQHIDEDRLKGQFLKALPDMAFIKLVYNKLCNYFQISYGEGEHTSHNFDFRGFCAQYNLNGNLTYNALQALDRNGIIALIQQFNFRTKIQFLVSNKALFAYLERNLDLNTLVKVLLRTYGGIFDYDTKVNLDLVIEKSSLHEHKVINYLKRLEKDGVISLDMANTDSELTFLKPREDDLTINPISKIVQRQNKLKQDQIQSVLDYVDTNDVCRSKQLLAYFGESKKEDCNICSVCLDKQKPNSDTESDVLNQQIINSLNKGDKSSRTLVEELKCNEHLLLTELSHLIEINKIKLTERNTYKLI